LTNETILFDVGFLMLSIFKKLKTKINLKRFNSTLPHEVASYAKSLQFFHWFQAVGITMLVASGNLKN
jgi:hypothetical protein